nr:zinc finger protein ZAT3-like [Ipomoea trifida]
MNEEKLAKLNVVGDDEGDIGGFPSKDYLCHKCGEGFGSKKAVYGHMRAHSKRPKVPVPKKRSTIGLKIASAGPSFSTWNKSSEPVVSEIDDEVKEAAACLMMLSRDTRSWNGERKTVVVNGDDGKRTESEEVFVEKFIRADDQVEKVNMKIGCQCSESGLQKVEVCMHRDDDYNKDLGGHMRTHYYTVS